MLKCGYAECRYLDSTEYKNQKEDVVLTDSKSVLDVLARHGEYELRVKLSKHIESRRVVLQCIPHTVALVVMKRLMNLIKEGANIQQENLHITIKQKTIIKNMFRVKKIHDYHKLERADKLF